MGTLPSSDLPNGLESVRAKLAQTTMEYVLGARCLLASPKAHVGRRFRWRLGGDFTGEWVMSLVPGEVGVRQDDSHAH